MAGTFVNFCNRTIDPAIGFTLAISYGYCESNSLSPELRISEYSSASYTGYTIAIASECSAAAILVSYWSDITPAVVITVSLVLILAINMSTVRFYGESEFVTSIIKVLCFLGLVSSSFSSLLFVSHLSKLTSVSFFIGHRRSRYRPWRSSRW